MLKSCKHNSKRDCPTFNPSYLYLICNLEDISSFSSLNSAIIHHQNVLYGSNESKEMSPRYCILSSTTIHCRSHPLNLYQYINLACLSVCLYPINVKTAEPIRPNFFVGHHVTTGKVYECSKFPIFVSIFTSVKVFSFLF